MKAGRSLPNTKAASLQAPRELFVSIGGLPGPYLARLEQRVHIEEQRGSLTWKKQPEGLSDQSRVYVGTLRKNPGFEAIVPVSESDPKKHANGELPPVGSGPTSTHFWLHDKKAGEFLGPIAVHGDEKPGWLG